MPNGSGPSPEQIEAWLEHVDRDLTAIQSQIEPLVAEQMRLQERRALLKELLGSFGDSPQAESTILRSSHTETTRERIHRQALEVFAQVGRPLDSHELLAEFLHRGHEVPGAGRPNNITVHLTGWEDIVSPNRGIYGLAEHARELPKPRSTTTRRRKRKV